MGDFDGSTKVVLVVEDEPAIGALCRRVFTDQGFRVDVAVNGKEAQISLEQQRYDVLLLDTRLPGMSGIELYRWLEKNHAELVKR